MLRAGVAAGSVALVSFGLDSAIEILASTIVIWHLRDTHANSERTALLVLGGAFLVVAVYVLTQATLSLTGDNRPDSSAVGIAWTAMTLVVMCALATAKARTGRALDNPVLLTEGRVTLVDAYLAAAVLAGLVANAAIGWWWATRSPRS